ncbi:MAG: hypothetical protein Kow00108_11290 [Calditrichia bacterium]
MSKKLLYHLNGNKNGIFKNWLDQFEGEPRIAWYPSAGEDFRDLLYLNPTYTGLNPAPIDEPKHPDIFIHTDYFPWKRSSFLDNKILYEDDRTKIIVREIEELPKVNLPLDQEIVDFPQKNIASDRVIFMEIGIESGVLGQFNAKLIYVFAENEAFCAKKILPNDGKISHIIHVRYGGGLGGGGKASGIWLLNILQKVNCEVFITSGIRPRQSGDEAAYRLYPELAGDEKNDYLEVIRTIDSHSWSDYGDVTWYLVGDKKY